jgi:hypothetical protein
MARTQTHRLSFPDHALVWGPDSLRLEPGMQNEKALAQWVNQLRLFSESMTQIGRTAVVLYQEDGTLLVGSLP